MDLKITGALLSAIAVFVMPAVSTKLMTAASAKHSDKVAETSRLSDMVRAFADLSEFGDLGFTDMSARRRYRVARHPVWRHHAARHRDQRLALTPGEQHDVGGAPTSRAERRRGLREAALPRTAVLMHEQSGDAANSYAAVPRSAGAASDFGGTGLVAEARRYLGTNPTNRGSLWCATFMNMVLERTGYRGTGSNLARSFANYGRRLAGPQVGAIAVMSRGRNGGHVGVVSGIDPKGNPIIVSGNHNRRVAEATYPRGRIYAYVVP
jgi:uncharacterized protein (TIGR02594 family)